MNHYTDVLCRLNALKQFRVDHHGNKTKVKKLKAGRYLRTYGVTTFGHVEYELFGQPYGYKSVPEGAMVIRKRKDHPHDTDHTYVETMIEHNVTFKYNAKTLAFVKYVKNLVNSGKIHVAEVISILRAIPLTDAWHLYNMNEYFSRSRTRHWSMK